MSGFAAALAAGNRAGSGIFAQLGQALQTMNQNRLVGQQNQMSLMNIGALTRLRKAQAETVEQDNKLLADFLSRANQEANAEKAARLDEIQAQVAMALAQQPMPSDFGALGLGMDPAAIMGLAGQPVPAYGLDPALTAMGVPGAEALANAGVRSRAGMRAARSRLAERAQGMVPLSPQREAQLQGLLLRMAAERQMEAQMASSRPFPVAGQYNRDLPQN